MSGNMNEALRWLKQAEKDLASAGNSLESSDYEWACFQAQQSAEKALKSVLYSKGFRKIITHSIIDLVIVADFKDKFHKRIPDVRGLTDLPIEPLCYTEEEFREMIVNKNVFITEVLREGMAI